ncbi:MAG: hypothetical protein M3R49_08555 [Chloroflexota bacterium]|nr:hypothetical protein [Chloroflexota bacterium]
MTLRRHRDCLRNRDETIDLDLRASILELLGALRDWTVRIDLDRAAA